ncbi:hypothetical protein SAMN05443428_10279 [Caloramator quimbayensis]|uniref:Uncharacterized protein n=1 Tax=Caloramator quimbayensis TaxID=1147123 RepID=A0A1T4WKR2_9CLOT|nr:hypothetical protein [Caloramator quimbayensis]SKA77894.1 hypothetical protein SAMN05443428_10279 [Caloramator quimbayensis]
MYKKTINKVMIRLLIVIYAFTLIPNYNKAYAALGAPRIVAPSNGSSIDKADIKVSWTSVTGANSYI